MVCAIATYAAVLSSRHHWSSTHRDTHCHQYILVKPFFFLNVQRWIFLHACCAKLAAPTHPPTPLRLWKSSRSTPNMKRAIFSARCLRVCNLGKLTIIRGRFFRCCGAELNEASHPGHLLGGHPSIHTGLKNRTTTVLLLYIHTAVYFVAS